MSDNLAISSAILWLQVNNVPIPADIQMYMRREMKILDPKILSNLEREAKFTRALEALMFVYREKVMRALARGVISQRLTDALRQELYHALQLNYYDAALDRLPQIAANFGIPAESQYVEELLYEWSTKQARDMSEQITKTTLQRLDSLIRLRQDEGLPLEADEIQKLLDFTFGEARVTTIAITETITARNMIVDIYRMQLDKLGIPNDERWLTSEDERVCEICGPADQKLKNEVIEEGDWAGRTWGQRFPYLKPHPRCRCKKVLERPQKFTIPQSLKHLAGTEHDHDQSSHAGEGSVSKINSSKTYFHYTNKKDAVSIKENGFVVSSGTISPLLGYGVFLTDEKGAFGEYGTEQIEVHLDVINTLSVSGGYAGYLNWVIQNAPSDNPDPRPEDITAIVRSKGYDSVHISGTPAGNIYIIFDPKNISIRGARKSVKGGVGSGDLEGHEFRGNQYTSGISIGDVETMAGQHSVTIYKDGREVGTIDYHITKDRKLKVSNLAIYKVADRRQGIMTQAMRDLIKREGLAGIIHDTNGQTEFGKLWAESFDKQEFKGNKTMVTTVKSIATKGGAGSGDLEGHEFRGNQYTSGGGSVTVQIRDIGNATARAESDGSISINAHKWDALSDKTKLSVMAHEIAHQTVEDFVLNNNTEWNKAVEALTIEKNSLSDLLFIGGNTRIGEAVADAVSTYVIDGTFGRDSSKWRTWADETITAAGYDKNTLAEMANAAMRDANKLTGK